MDDAIRQAIDVLEGVRDEKIAAGSIFRMGDNLISALIALKAIQPRPDVVVAARELHEYKANIQKGLLESGLTDTLWLVQAAFKALEAALADEQEYEVRWAWGSGAETFATESLARKDLGVAWPCGDHPDDVRRAFVEKAKPKPVSREQAVEDVLRDLEIEADLSPSVPSLTVAKAVTAFRAALSRVRETG